MSKKIIAIDLGGTTAKMAIISPEGEIQDKWSLQTQIVHGGSLIVPNLIKSIQDRLKLYHLQEKDILGIGMGTPGVVDSARGTVVGAYNLNWDTVQELKFQFNKAFKLPFYIENDANIAALGEQWLGAGQGEADVVMITLGTGVGGGIISSGSILKGSSHAAGEIGHITVDLSGKYICTCGKPGCLEAVASATGIVNIAREFSNNYEGDSEVKLMIDDGQEVSAKMIIDAAKKGDYFSLQVFEKFSMYLGLACSHLANILNPSTIVIGGGVSLAGNFLLNQVQKNFVNFTFKPVIEKTALKLATLGNDAGIIGAASLVIRDLAKNK